MDKNMKKIIDAKIIKAMKLTFYLMLITCVQAWSTGFSQHTIVNASFRGVSMDQFLSVLESKTPYRFVIDKHHLPADYRITLEASELPLSQVLDRALRPVGLTYKVFNDQLIALAPAAFHLQEIRISGTVRNENGEPLPGVAVTVIDSPLGTHTDEQGAYAINVPQNSILRFSSIGYLQQEVPVDRSRELNLTLLEDLTSLREVVVIGYGSQQKRDVTGAISSISSEAFENQPVTRLDQVLQGRAAGVQVINSTGAPGGAVRIRIRGANSLSGSNDPLYVVDGFIGADFTTINPDDIASIDVLKDASATAIYGSRGANGVVIITTKSGESGQTKIDFGTRFYSSSLIKKHETLNPADFAIVANERERALTPAGGTYVPKFTEEQIARFRQEGGTDWQDEIFHTAPGMEYQLGISGGNEKTRFMISGNYLQQDGIIINSDFKRYSIRTNIHSQLTEKLTVRANLSGTRRENHNTGGTAARGGALAQALAWAPTTPVRDEDGNYILHDPTSSLFSNPVAIAKENENRGENTNLNMVASLQYEFLPGLSLNVQGGLNYLNAQNKTFAGIPATRSTANAARSSNENILWQNTNTVTYSRTFDEDHQLDVTGVLELQQFTGTGFNVNATDLTYPAQKYDNLALSASNLIGSGYSGWSLLSQLGRINYAYQSRYLLSVALRRDGSSKFRGKNKYSLFPSVSLGWNMTEESFLQTQEMISHLKIRGSWGLTGNQGIGPYGTLSAYVTNIDDAGAIFDGNGGITAGILMGNPGNPDLKWETTEQLNIGADLELFHGKAQLTVDYFVKDTRDLLMLRTLPQYIGGYSIQSNIGELRNKGWEFSLGITPVNSGDFRWHAALNLSLLDNKITSLGGDRDTIPLNENVLIPGRSMNSFWGYKYLGTWKASEAAEAARYGLAPGDARYADTDNNGAIDENDFQVIGNGTPRTALGWNNTFSYKNVSLNVFLQGFFGFDKLNYTYAFGMVGSTDAKEIIFADIKKRYIPGVNETSDIPAFSSAGSNLYTQTSRFIERGDFLRLKNVSLSYLIPETTLRNIAGVRLFVSVTNLFTFTNYKGIDPESNSNAVSGLTWQNYGTDVQQGTDFGSYPNAKTFTAGVNLIF